MRVTTRRKRARSASRRSPQHQREQSDDQQQAAQYEADGIGSQHVTEIGRTKLNRHRLPQPLCREATHSSRPSVISTVSRDDDRAVAVHLSQRPGPFCGGSRVSHERGGANQQHHRHGNLTGDEEPTEPGVAHAQTELTAQGSRKRCVWARAPSALTAVRASCGPFSSSRQMHFLFLRVAAFRAGFAVADRLETGVFLVPVAGFFACAVAPFFATRLAPVGRLVALGPVASASLPGPGPGGGTVHPTRLSRPFVPGPSGLSARSVSFARAPGRQATGVPRPCSDRG